MTFHPLTTIVTVYLSLLPCHCLYKHHGAPSQNILSVSQYSIFYSSVSFPSASHNECMSHRTNRVCIHCINTTNCSIMVSCLATLKTVWLVELLRKVWFVELLNRQRGLVCLVTQQTTRSGLLSNFTDNKVWLV